MNYDLPPQLKKRDPILADWLNTVRSLVLQNRIKPSATVKIEGQDESGVMLRANSESLRAVLVTKDGGSAGSSSTNCTFTYTVKDLSGLALGSGLTPKRPRYANTEYYQPATDSYGLAFIANNTLNLYEAIEERPKETSCA